MTARRAIEPTEPRPGFFGRHKAAIAVAVSFAVLLGGGLGAYLVARQQFAGLFSVKDYPGPGEADVTVTVPKGTTLTGIGDLLVAADVVASREAFTRVASQNPEANGIQAGRYLLQTRLPAAEALAMLLDPSHLQRTTFTLREGKWLADHVKVMSKASDLPAKEFEALLKSAKGLDLPSWATGTAEGFLFPDTYAVPDEPSASTMIGLATTRFNDVTAELDFATRAKALGVTPSDALIVASIIEREVFRDQDRAKVARVIYNRLDAGMMLQMDSTVAYAAGKTGTVWTTKAERDSDSPYNTYKHVGLPIGPIASPAKAALKAAIAPADGRWLFFMPVNLDTGETRFSTTLAEHRQAAAELQAWCKKSDANAKKCA